MAEKTLNGFRVAVLAAQYFEQSELVEPRRVLDEAGARTVVVSPHGGSIQAVKHAEKAESVKVDLELARANPAEFDAPLLPGGALNADALRVQPKAQEFARAIEQAGKLIAVICHGPWLLISAGLVRGRKLTSYHTIQDDIRNAGGVWQDREAVRDRNWVSSRQPSDLPAFNRELLALFSEHAQRRRHAA